MLFLFKDFRTVHSYNLGQTVIAGCACSDSLAQIQCIHKGLDVYTVIKADKSVVQLIECLPL